VWRRLYRSKLLAAGLTWLAVLAGAGTAAAADNVDYNGGPVAHSMKGVLVDWGPNINPMYTDPTSGDPGLIKYLAAQSGSTSDIGGVLAQYMDSSDHNAANQVSYGGQYQITPSTTANPVMDSQIQTELVNQVDSGALPQPTGNGLSTLYLVLFPQSDSECISSSECSANAPDPTTQDFCAYHSATQLPNGTFLLYAVIPDDTTGNQSQWCGAASSVFADQTSYLSHEWSETISDPLGTAWWVNNSSSSDNGNEVGDNCNQLMTSEGGWTVQLTWSNRDANCVGGESTYSAPTASFLAPSAGEPGQSLSFDASSSSDPGADNTAISGTSYSIGSGLTGYSWNWGDGTTSTSATPTASHAYASPGTYQVSLTVTDNLGFTSTVTKSVQVTSNGVPAPVPAPAPSPGTGPTTTTTTTTTPSPSPTPPPAVQAVTAPGVSTGAVGGVTSSGATASGAVAPGGSATSYLVEFGTSTAYGHSTPRASAGAGTGTVPVSVTLSGLRPHTVYHYRLVATNAGGTSVGGDRTFRTARAPGPAPRFSFALPGSARARAALHGRLRLRFSCSRACTSHFLVTVGSARATRFAPVAVTLARATGRIGHGGSALVTLRFLAGVASRLAGQPGLRLIVSGYAVAGGSASTQRVRRVTIS
jgi:PKD repeat protein